MFVFFLSHFAPTSLSLDRWIDIGSMVLDSCQFLAYTLTRPDEHKQETEFPNAIKSVSMLPRLKNIRFINDTDYYL